MNETLGPHTPVQALARNEAQAAVMKAVRLFVNQYLRFAPVSNIDRLAMGVLNHDAIRTDHRTVNETVNFVIRLRNIRELVVKFWEQGRENKAKPKGYDGAVIIWGVMDKAPEHPSDLKHHAMASRTPAVLRFEEPERGKAVYIALAWQNNRGVQCPWSHYKSAIIP